MRRSTGRLVLTVLTVVGAAAGCGSGAPPTAPVGPPTPPPPVAVAPRPPLGLPPADAFPPLARPGAAYVADLSLYADHGAYHGGWLASRLVLYESGGNRFGLQFSSPRFGFFEYGGVYVVDGARIALAFDLWNTATATVHGDSLSVRYNAAMQMADFVDGVYVRAPATP